MEENTIVIDEENEVVIDNDNLDNNIVAGLQFIMNETAKYNEIISSAKTEIKKKIFRKKIKKLQKELQMLLYVQHMREKQKSAPVNEIIDADFEEVNELELKSELV